MSNPNGHQLLYQKAAAFVKRFFEKNEKFQKTGSRGETRCRWQGAPRPAARIRWE
ncbi:hypothetical protein HMPREF1545_03359 [Oscillibacter sp. KLE 1728]|nr:hypothetical protein HMPREF1545_03359 [Oscillibacter sp. KLE 1728]